MTETSQQFLTNKKILVAIGTKPVRDIIVNMCRDLGAVDVLFGNGADLVVELARFTPDLVLGQYAMSPMDGPSFFSLMRSKLKKPIPMIMLVSSQDRDGPAKSRQAGAIDCVSMPFSLNDVIAATRKAMDRATVTAGSGLRFGPRPG